MTRAKHRFNNSVKYRSESHPNQTQLTPSYVLEPITLSLGGVIDLDPCTEPDNPCGALHFFTPPVDGAEEDWAAYASIFVNPPYSKAKDRWVRKCIKAGSQGAKVALLIPSATETGIYQEALKTASGLTLVKGRLSFGLLRPNRRQVEASHPSSILTWNCDLKPLVPLGKTVDLIRGYCG